MFPYLQLGPLSIPAPGLIMLVGLWLALYLVEKIVLSSKYDPIKPDILYNLALIGLIGGLVGARFVYAARHINAFILSPSSLFSLNPGLLDPWGGLVIGVLVSAIYGYRRILPLWPVLDALTPGLAVMGVAFGLSRLASGNAYGQPTDLPWAILLWEEMRHPTQAYETLAALIILAVVLALILRARPTSKQLAGGFHFLSFVALTAAAHLFIEGFRAESILVTPAGLRAVQVAAWMILALSLWGLGKRIQFDPEAVELTIPVSPDQSKAEETVE